MKILIILFLLVLISVVVTTAAYGTHQDLEKSCSISIDGKLFPISYNQENRNNPDGTFYPGDGFHYIFRYEGTSTCQSVSIDPIKSKGINVSSHYTFVGNSTSNYANIHSHHNKEQVIKYLQTTHYHLITYVQDCSMSVEIGQCEAVGTINDKPLFSIREDDELTRRQYAEIVDDDHITKYTYSWGYTAPQENHNHSLDDSAPFEDPESITQFEEQVNENCFHPNTNGGCVYGHAEISVNYKNQRCLYAELAASGINPQKPVSGDKKHQQSPDVCLSNNAIMELTVTANKRSCGDNGCKTIKLTRTTDLYPNIINPEYEIILTKPTLKDRDYYDAKNLDGTYYPNDPIAIVHDPTFLWKEVRSETIQFETTKTYDLINESEFDCNKNNCDYTVQSDGLFPTNHTLVNGQGMTIYNATLGEHSFNYTMIAKNLDRQISNATNTITALGVDYFPQYESFTYPLLKDVQEYAFDDRQAVALHYLGNQRDGIIHTEERSKINGFHNIGVMYDLPDPYYINQNFTFSEGINTSDDTISLKSYNNTAMFLQEGYGKLYFDWPINHIISPYGFNMYTNVTSHTIIYSDDFAGKDTMLHHFELRYPETAFTKDIIIKSINQKGDIISTDKIELDIIPYKNKSEYLNVYLYNKVLYDTKNKIFAEIVSGDTNPMNHTLTGYGMINGTIAKTMVLFENYDIYIGDSIKKLDAMLIDNSIYERQGYDLSYRSPSDIVLSHLTPHTFQITINDSITREFPMRYYAFGGKQTMTINIQNDNELSAKRSIGFTKIQKPENFGYIDALFVNDKPIHRDCSNGCVLFLLPPGELHIVAKNVWGGVASATVPKEPEPVIIVPKEPDYTLFITAAFFALFCYIIYKRFIKGKI